MTPQESALRNMYGHIWSFMEDQSGAQSLRLASVFTWEESDKLIRRLVVPDADTPTRLGVLRGFPKRSTLESLCITQSMDHPLNVISRAILMDNAVSNMLKGVRELVVCGIGFNCGFDDVCRVCLMCPSLSSLSFERMAVYPGETPLFDADALVPLKCLTGLRKLGLTKPNIRYPTAGHTLGAELLGVSALTGLTSLAIREAPPSLQKEICAAIACIGGLVSLDLQFYGDPSWDPSQDVKSALSGLTQLKIVNVDVVGCMPAHATP